MKPDPICDRCASSIPFPQVQIISVDGRAYHAECAGVMSLTVDGKIMALIYLTQQEGRPYDSRSGNCL